jgi:hypothetical protein
MSASHRYPLNVPRKDWTRGLVSADGAGIRRPSASSAGCARSHGPLDAARLREARGEHYKEPIALAA